jgi:invasion protein IalB
MNVGLAFVGALAVVVCALMSALSAFMATWTASSSQLEDDVSGWSFSCGIYAGAAGVIAFAMAVAR